MNGKMPHNEIDYNIYNLITRVEGMPIRERRLIERMRVLAFANISPQAKMAGNILAMIEDSETYQPSGEAIKVKETLRALMGDVSSKTIDRYISELSKCGFVIKPKRRGLTTKIYVISAEGGPIKIGISDDPEQRKRCLQQNSPFYLRVAWTSDVSGDDAWDVEDKAHEFLHKYRMRGEWFNTSVENGELASIKAISEISCLSKGMNSEEDLVDGHDWVAPDVFKEKGHVCRFCFSFRDEVSDKDGSCLRSKKIVLKYVGENHILCLIAPNHS